MNQQTSKKIKIVSCSNSMFWYNKHTSEIFDVVKETSTEYWVRELGAWRCLNFVLKQDAKEIS